jgi:hypothetical protein
MAVLSRHNDSQPFSKNEYGPPTIINNIIKNSLHHVQPSSYKFEKYTTRTGKPTVLKIFEPVRFRRGLKAEIDYQRALSVQSLKYES